MLKFKKIFKKYKIAIIITIILICSIAIAYGVGTQITKENIEELEKEESQNNYEELRNDFQDIFTNSINKEPTAKLNINYDELLYCKYNINKKEDEKYNINAKIPQFKEESEILQKTNEEIFDIFAREVGEISNNTSGNIVYNVDYVAYVNNNIVSLVIMCKYKKGSNPQRIIVQTYNYDIENDKMLDIEEIVAYKNLDKENVQKKIQEEIQAEIKEENKQMQNIKDQGYNLYVRDEKAEMYNVDKTPNFFLGKNNYLYLVYSYGNNEYTSKIDLVIF